MENFKLVTSQQNVSFKENALNVLDGPNGYGKTSIFDAIEILINGQRYREDILDTSSNIQFKPLTFANDPNSPVTLIGTFVSESESFTVKRFFEKSDKDGRSHRVKAASQLFIKIAGNDFVTITEEDFHKKIGLTKSGKDFNMLYYIQQEESTSFLKKKEKDRIEELSHLFNMSSEQENIKKIQLMKRKIKSLKQELKEHGSQLSIKLDGYHKVEKVSNKPRFENLFDNPLLLWDQENPILDKKSYEFSLAEIDKLESFLIHKNDFLTEKENRKLEDMISNKQEILNLVLISSETHQNKEALLKRQLDQQRINEALESIESENLKIFLENLSDDNFQSFEFDKTEFFRLNLEIEADKKTLSTQQTLLANLSSLRDKLWNEFQNNINHEIIYDVEKCPMCGYDYIENENLMMHVQKTTDSLQEIMGSGLVSAEGKQIKLTELTTKLKNQLLENKNLYSNNDRLVNDLKKYEVLLSQIENTKAYLSDKNIDYKCLQVTEKTTDAAYSEKVNHLISQIREKIQVNQIYVADVYKKWVSIFQRYFNSDESKLPIISKEGFENKRHYLTYLYFTSSEREYSAVYEEFEKNTKQAEKLDCIIKKIEDVEKVYTEKIKVYQTTMINLIQIPLFIFSGKLLQNYPGGLGIFIDIDEEGKYLKLLTDSKPGSVDGVSKLSTGQLSSLVITLVLAMNKIFSKNELNVIFIDDPVQSMDEINVNAFIDIMRHEFKGYQIILSTHEEKIAMFFDYKYRMSNLPSQNFNVQKQFLVR